MLSHLILRAEDENHEVPGHVPQGHAGRLERLRGGWGDEGVALGGVLEDGGQREEGDREGWEEGDHVRVPDFHLEGLEVGHGALEQPGGDDPARGEDSEADAQGEERVVEEDLERDAIARSERARQPVLHEAIDERAERAHLARHGSHDFLGRLGHAGSTIRAAVGSRWDERNAEVDRRRGAPRGSLGGEVKSVWRAGRYF